LQSSSHTRLYETQQLHSQGDLQNALSAKKSKTPHRVRATNQMHVMERTQAIADKLRESVFKVTREEDEFLSRQPRSSRKGEALQDSTNTQDNLRVRFPESPSIQSMHAHAYPTVSAKIFQRSTSPEQLCVWPTMNQPCSFSPVKDPKKLTREKDNHTVERLAHDFFSAAIGDTKCEELEKAQLQQAISALSERLLLLQNISEDKKVVERKLEASELARSDLQKVLGETSLKTKQELGRLDQYQEIMLQENRAISEQLDEHVLALQKKEQECDEAHIKIALLCKRIESLQLSLAELANYRSHYQEQSQVTLVTQETRIEQLHKDLEQMAVRHREAIRVVSAEKEVLISESVELKQRLAQSNYDQEVLKSELDRQRAHTQTLQSELDAEKQQVARIKACSGDLMKLESELRFCQDLNAEMTERVQQTQRGMEEQQEVVEEKLGKLLEEKMTVEGECKSLIQDIKRKDEIIKQLTRENLAVNSNLTQVQQLLCAQEDQEVRMSALQTSLEE